MIKVDDIPNPTAEQLAELPREVGFVPSTNVSPKFLRPEQIADYNEHG